MAPQRVLSGFSLRTHLAEKGSGYRAIISQVCQAREVTAFTGENHVTDGVPLCLGVLGGGNEC